MQCDPKGYQIVVLGDGGVGKTSLTMGLCGHKFSQTYDPTIEDSFRTHITINDILCPLDILDTAGQEEYVNLRDDWIRQGDGIVLVYDVTSQASFASFECLIKQVMQVKWDLEGSTASRPSRLPIMIVGNKIDMVEKQVVRATEGLALARKYGCEFTETSAKSMKNVAKAFHDVVKILLPLSPHSSDDAPSFGSLPGAVLSSWKKLFDGGCCAVM
ncbi:putative small G-protein Ras2 [Nemania serpens]|nr:putative small G-protein Ras2 [Nemania serpens]